MAVTTQYAAEHTSTAHVKYNQSAHFSRSQTGSFKLLFYGALHPAEHSDLHFWDSLCLY